MGNSGAKPGKGDSMHHPLPPSSSSSPCIITNPIRGGGRIGLDPEPVSVHCSYMPLEDAAGCLHTVAAPRRALGLSPPLAPMGDSPIAPASDASTCTPSFMNLANSETGKIKQLEPEYPRLPGEPDCSYSVKFGSFSHGMKCGFNSETGEIKQLEPEYLRRPGEPNCPMGDFPITPSSDGSAAPPSLMNLANSEPGEINQLEPEYPRRPGQPDCTMGDSSMAPSSDGSSTPPPSMNLTDSETGEIKQLEPEYQRQPGEPDCRMGDSSSFSSLSITTPPSGKKKRNKEKKYHRYDGSAAPPVNLETGEIKQLEPEYQRRPGEPDCRMGDSSSFSSLSITTPPSGKKKRNKEKKYHRYDGFAAPPANSETGEIKQLEPEYQRQPGEPDCRMGDSSSFSSLSITTPPSGKKKRNKEKKYHRYDGSAAPLANSETGEIKQLEPEYQRRPDEPDCRMGDSSSFSSLSITTPPSGKKKRNKEKKYHRYDGSAAPPANSETGEIKQLEPEYQRQPGEPDCRMGDSSSFSSLSITTPPSGKKKRNKEKKYHRYDGSAAPLANSETGEIKQLEPEYQRRPDEPDCRMGDSSSFSSLSITTPPSGKKKRNKEKKYHRYDGSAAPPANSETGEIKQLEPEYQRRPGEPDCRMGDSSSFSSLSITTPPSGEKKRNEEKKYHRYDGSAAPPANSETGEKQLETEYPLRPGKRDCSYYVKFGSCRYGMNCWFNHPLYRPGQDNGGGRNGGGGGSRASNSSEYKQYFSGKACNYNRHEGKTKVKQVKLNFLGLPLRPGTQLCLYYLDRGTCKFGTNCKFHHPDPESEHANSNASQHAIQGSSQMNLSTTPIQRAQNGKFVPLVTSPTSGTSEIIPTEGVNPCTEWSGYQIDENKQGKLDWDPFTTKVFCDICTDEVLAGNRPTDHLNAIGYNNLCAKFNEKTTKGYNHEQFKSKWESLKKDYQTWKALMESEDDIGQDPEMNTTASLEWWPKKMEVMPDCGKFYFAPLENVNLLNIMFEDMLDSSSTSPEANLAVNTTIESEQGAGDGHSKEAMLPKSSNKEPNSAKLKIDCVHAELNDLVNFDENVNPSNLATSMRIDRVGSNISEIMELVVDAGAEEGSDEHFIATQLFIRPEHREMFLTLKTPRGRLGWLKKMCQVKELL